MVNLLLVLGSVAATTVYRWFNRIPTRVSRTDAKHILSPTDGRVLQIISHADAYQVVISSKNQLLGRITCSSRVDVTVPKHARVLVQEGDTVVGNHTILAQFGTVVYMDGVFDLFHVGHVRAIQQMRAHGDTVVIGVLGDQDATTYKRQPFINETARAEIVSACRYVDRVICPCPLIITHAFLKEHQIDTVVHAYANQNDRDNQKQMTLGIPVRELCYSTETSTTDILSKLSKKNT